MNILQAGLRPEEQTKEELKDDSHGDGQGLLAVPGDDKDEDAKSESDKVNRFYRKDEEETKEGM